jgi:hypothetical protein
MKSQINKSLRLFYLIFWVVFLATHHTFAQDIYLKVKKGTVIHNGNNMISSSPAFQMKNSDKISVAPDAILSGRMGANFFQVPSGKSYAYSDVKKMCKDTPVKASVSGELFNGSMQKITNNYGSSTRSGEPEPDSYSPTDTLFTLIVLDKKFKLQIGNKQTKLLTNIKLVHKNSSKIIYDSKPDNKTVELSDLPEGEYTWSYQIEFVRNDSDIQQKLSNVFIIPSESQRAQMLSDYNNVKKELAANLNRKCISKDLYDILLSEYKEKKKIFITE